jgi:fatty-acyl-CoA synthase
MAFEELLCDAEQIARRTLIALTADRPPRAIGLLMANGEPWLRGLLATFRLGAAAVPLALPVAFSGREAYLAHLRRVARDAGLDALLIDASSHRLVLPLREALPEVPLVDVTDVPAGPLPAWSGLPDEAGAEDLAVIQYTSGSTSAPKGVALTHANVSAGLAAVTGGVDWRSEDVVGIWIPLFHDMGLFLTLSAFARGSSVWLWRPSEFIRRTRDWLAAFAASPATVSAAPNFGYDYLVAAGAPDGLDLSGWRVAFNGAEPVQRRTIERFTETFGPYGFRPEAMLPCYGLAESVLGVAFHPVGVLPRALDVDRFSLGPGDRVRVVDAGADEARPVVSVGRAVPGIEIRVAAEDGGRLLPGVVGEVQVRGPSVMRGYLGRPAREQPFTADSWLKTADLAFDWDGDLFIVGRTKNMIVVRGQNYYAEDVEEVVRGTPGVQRRHCAAVGLELDGREQLLVLVETSLVGEAADEAAALADRVEQQIVRQLGLDAVRVHPVAPRTIPFTSSGKAQRHAVRALYERRELGGVQRGWREQEAMR